MVSGDTVRFLGLKASIAELQQLFWTALSCVKVKSSVAAGQVLFQLWEVSSAGFW